MILRIRSTSSAESNEKVLQGTNYFFLILFSLLPCREHGQGRQLINRAVPNLAVTTFLGSQEHFSLSLLLPLQVDPLGGSAGRFGRTEEHTSLGVDLAMQVALAFVECIS
jgi:hypothetical protein